MQCVEFCASCLYCVDGAAGKMPNSDIHFVGQCEYVVGSYACKTNTVVMGS